MYSLKRLRETSSSPRSANPRVKARKISNHVFTSLSIMLRVQEVRALLFVSAAAKWAVWGCARPETGPEDAG
jgi:hypothetical protein